MKSGKFDTPIDFNPSIKINGYNIYYDNLREVAQGSPRIGRLSINNHLISNYYFGGPFLFTDSFIYIPAFIKSSFILTKINLATLLVSIIGHSSDYICLEKIENNKIYFRDSIYDDILKVYDLNPYKISNSSDTVISFSSKLVLDNYSFEFHSIETVRKEVKVGNLTINGKSIDSYKFGSPFLYNNSQILIPVFIKGFFRSGFKLALIDLNDLSINIFGKKENIISLISFENCNKITYYTDLTKSTKKVIML